MSYREFDSIDAFTAAAHAAGLGRVVLAWQQEYGPRAAVTEGAHRADYGRVRTVLLLGYHAGDILRCTLDGAHRNEVRALLEAAGLSVELRSRNLTNATGTG